MTGYAQLHTRTDHVQRTLTGIQENLTVFTRSVQKFILRYMDGNGTTRYAQIPFLTFVKPAEVCLWHFGFNTSSLFLAVFQYSC